MKSLFNLFGFCSKRKPQTLLEKFKTPFDLKISQKNQISHDTVVFKLKFENDDQILGLNVGEHIVIHAIIDNEEIERKYTPISPHDQEGSLDLLIKIYHKCERFPNGGQLTQFLDKLNVGDSMKISGPKGKLNYLDNGNVKIQNKVKQYKKIAMIAGGTGITPMYQVIQRIHQVQNDNTEIYLLFANKTEQDILLREELEQFSRQKLKLFYTLDNPPQDWNGFSGFITKEMLEKCFPQISNDLLLVTCGPGPMNNICLKHFKEMGASIDNIFKF